MIATIISSIFSNILIIVLIIYQIQKNKSLQDRIKNQERIINQTNEIVSSQATAIDSQSKIVDTALKYTNTFSIEKIENIIRRELNIEKAEELKHIENQYKEILNKEVSEKCRIDDEKKNLQELLTTISKELIVPYMSSIIKYLLTHYSEKESFLEVMKEGKAKDILLSTLDELESEYKNKTKSVEEANA